MAKKNKQRARRKAQRPPPPVGPASVQDISDDVLELIFLRLHSSVCLVHAASTCKRWRRIVANAGFLRRFGSLQTPPILGHYYTVASLPHASNPFFVPSPSVAIDSDRFSLDFLPNSGSWELAGSRGSLLLLIGKASLSRYYFLGFPDLVVCEPLTRRYQGIVPPAELRRWLYLRAFLLDGTADELGGCLSMSNFRVLCAVNENGTPRACVFSSGSDGGWHAVRSAVANDIRLRWQDFAYFAGRAGECLYWAMRSGNLLVLDKSTAEFSLVVMPEDMRWSYDMSNLRIVGGDGGVANVLRLTSDDLEVCAQVQGSMEWAVEKSLRWPEAVLGYFGRAPKIVAAGAGFVILKPVENIPMFSVNLETMEVESAYERYMYTDEAYPYACLWPPPALHACVDDGRRRRRR